MYLLVVPYTFTLFHSLLSPFSKISNAKYEISLYKNTNIIFTQKSDIQYNINSSLQGEMINVMCGFDTTNKEVKMHNLFLYLLNV